MKRILLLLLFLIGTHLAFGQFRVYPKVGMVISSQNLEGYATENSKIKNKIGFLAGGGLEGRIYQNLMWNSEVQFAQLGYVEEYRTRHEYNKATSTSNYIIAPIALKYDVIGANHKLFLTGGVYGGIFMGDIPAESTQDKLDWGVQTGCGYSFSIGGSDFVADARYSLGMSDVKEAKYFSWARGSHQVSYNARNRYFSLSIGYVLPFSRKST